MAYEGTEPIGFAGMSARRFRCGTSTWEFGFASFAAVRPQWRQLPVAITIYKELFSALHRMERPFLAFAVDGGDAWKLLMFVLKRLGFMVLPLGSTRTHIYVAGKNAPPAGEWEVEVRDIAGREDAAFGSAHDDATIFCDVTDDQWKHYWRDPRGRALLLLRNRSTNARGAAWVVRGEYVTRSGIRVVPTLEGVYVPGYDPSALPFLFHAAARWSNSSAPVYVNAPNLTGFDLSALSTYGIRNSGNGFLGICGAPVISPSLSNVRGTTTEIV
jgi:hypothetical protein